MFESLIIYSRKEAGTSVGAQALGSTTDSLDEAVYVL